MLKIERLMSEAERRGHGQCKSQWIVGTMRPGKQPLAEWSSEQRAAFLDGQAYAQSTPEPRQHEEEG